MAKLSRPAKRDGWTDRLVDMVMAGTAQVWRKPRRQVAALPFRFEKDGQLQVMLVTSRETRRWVVPKGWPMAGLKPHEAAEREAFEEAGLIGHIARTPIGSYAYEKRLKTGAAVSCLVEVFPFEVKRQRKRWPEKDQRDGRWFAPEAAAQAVDEPGLKTLIAAWGAKAGRKHRGGGAPETPILPAAV